MTDDDLREVLAGAGHGPTDEFRSRLRGELAHATAEQPTDTDDGDRRRGPWWLLATAAALIAVIAAAIVVTGGDDRVVIDTPGSTSSVPDDSTEDDSTAPTLFETVDDLEAALVGPQWVLTASSPVEFDSALRPTISFAVDEVGVWSIGGYEGCNWWSSELDAAVVDGVATMRLGLQGESTLMSCPDENGPRPGLEVAYEVRLPQPGTLVLAGPGIELIYVDLDSLDGLRPITADDLADSWRFPGTDRLELVATAAGPRLRHGDCLEPIGVPEPGRLLLERAPDWSNCGGLAPVGGVSLGQFSQVLVDGSGSTPVPRAAEARVGDDVMFLLGPLSHVYRLERVAAYDPGAFDDLVGDDLVIVGPETGPAIRLRITSASDGEIEVRGHNECRGYSGLVRLDDDGVVTTSELELDANGCSLPTETDPVRTGDRLVPSTTGLTIDREGDLTRLVALDDTNVLDDPAEIESLGEALIGGRRARFGPDGLVDVDGCLLAWRVDDTGRLTTPGGDPGDPLCPSASPEILASGLQAGGVTFHRTGDGTWIRMDAWDQIARVVTPPGPDDPLWTFDDLAGLPLVAIGGPATDGRLPVVQVQWHDGDRLRLAVDIGCGPEVIDLLLDAVDDSREFEIVAVERDPFAGPCDSPLLPAPGDRVSANDALEITGSDRSTAFVWIDSWWFTTPSAPPTGDYLLGDRRVAVDDTTVTVDGCTQAYEWRDGVMVLPLRDDPAGCAWSAAPDIAPLLTGAVDVRRIIDSDLVLERNGTAGLLLPDLGTPLAEELARLWFLERSTAPAELAVVAPSFQWMPGEDGRARTNQVAIFTGCTRGTYEIVLGDEGVIERADVIGGTTTCPDADVPFAPTTFRVGDRLELDGWNLRFLAPDGSFRHEFTSNPTGSILSAQWSDAVGDTGTRTWRPAGTEATPIVFSNVDGEPYVEYGDCASAATFGAGRLQLEAWPAQGCVPADAPWIDRVVAAELAASVEQPMPIWKYGGVELHLDGARVVRLDPIE